MPPMPRPLTTPADLRSLDVAALLIADIALAKRLGWPCTVPIIIAACCDAAFKDASGKRIRPDHPDWTGAATRATPMPFMRPMINACCSRRGQRRCLAPSSVPKAGRGARAILSDECIKANALTMLGSERAAHRMLDTLSRQGVLRELTRRHVFRLTDSDMRTNAIRTEPDEHLRNDLLPEDLRWRESMGRIEAVLFASAAPVPRDVLAKLAGDEAVLDDLIAEIRDELKARPMILSLLPAVISSAHGRAMPPRSGRL